MKGVPAHNLRRLLAAGLLAGVLAGCSVRERTRQSGHRELEGYRMRTDSLAAGGLHAAGGTGVRLVEVVRLSPPDSSGRQHVTAFGRARTLRTLHASSRDSLFRLTGQGGGIRARKETEADTRKEGGTAPLWQRTLLPALLAAALLGCLYRLSGRRRDARRFP